MIKASLVLLLVACTLVAKISTRDSLRSYGRRVQKRDAIDDAFNAFEDKMTKLSRLVTGISLQTGLADGSIPIDKVLGELLGLGNVGVNQLEEAVKTGFKEFLEKTNTALSKLNDEAMTTWTNMYNFHSIKEDIKKDWNTAALSSLPPASVLNELDSLKTMDFSKIVSLDLQGSIDILKKNNTSKYGSLKTSLTNFGTAVSSFRPTTWKKYSDVLGKIAPLAWLAKHSEKLDKLYPHGLKKNPDKQIAAAKAIVASVSSISSIGNLDFMSLDLFSTRTIHNDRVHSIGFANGIQDIKDISAVAKDPWIAEITNSSVDPETLKVLEQLHGKLVEVDNSWTTSFAMISVVQKASEFKNSLTTAQLSEDRIKPVVDGLNNCADSRKLDADADKLGMTIYNIVSKFTSLRRIVELLTDGEKKKFKALDKANDVSGLADLRKLLTNLTEDVKVLKDAPDLKTSIDDLNVKYGSVVTATFSNDFGVKEMVTIFDCLYKMTEKTEDIANYYREVIASLNNLKTSPLLPTMQSLADQISNASQNLQVLRKVQDDLKEDKSPGLAKMMKLKPLQQYSKPLGESVSALVAIKSTLAHKGDFDEFKSKGDRVDTEIGKVAADKQLALTTMWGDFQKSSQAVQTLLDSAAAKKQNLPAVAGSSLADFGPLFESLTGIASPNLRINEKLQALDALLLSPTVDASARTAIQKVQESLKKMAEVNLQFASYDASLGGMTTTLDQVAGTIQNPPPSNSSKSLNIDEEDDYADKTDDEDQTEPPASPLILYIALSIVGLFAIALIIHLIKLILQIRREKLEDKKRQEQKMKEKNKKKKKSSDPSTTKTESVAESTRSSVQ